VGATQAAWAVDSDPRAEEFCDTSGGGRYPGGASETLRQVSWASEGQPLGAGHALSRSQDGRLIRPVGRFIGYPAGRQFSAALTGLKDKLKGVLESGNSKPYTRPPKDFKLTSPR
jgi:hypothetical protein